MERLKNYNLKGLLYERKKYIFKIIHYVHPLSKYIISPYVNFVKKKLHLVIKSS